MSKKTRIFWESTLYEIIAFFRTRQSRCKTKFQKKSLFWGIFSYIFFITFPFLGYVFTLRFLGGPRRPVGCPRKNGIFSDASKNCPKKWRFFAWDNTVFFWLQRSYCGDGYHISPPTALNLESAEISTSKLANSKQQISKSIQQFLKCTLISSPLVRWKWPTQVGTLGTLWWGWELRMMQSTTSAGVSKKRPKKKKLFSGIWKNVVFSGHGSRMTIRKNPGIWLAGWLSGWLAGYLAGWLSGWLAIWLIRWLAAIWQLALLPGWLFGY